MKNVTINYAKARLMGIDPIATGRQLKKLRREHHLTQEYLSELFEQGFYSVSRVSISAWENSKKLPKLDHLVFLSELYGCSLDELVISYRRSRESADRDQPVPYYLYYLPLRRMYATLHMFAFFFCILLIYGNAPKNPYNRIIEFLGGIML